MLLSIIQKNKKEREKNKQKKKHHTKVNSMYTLENERA